MYCIQEDTTILIDIMCNILNVSKVEMLECRFGLLPSGRALISKKLLSLGYNVSSIGKVLKKNHSTILYSIKKINYELTTVGYDDVRELNDKFESEIKSYKDKLVGASSLNQIWKCIWKVSPQDRLCRYCTLKDCLDRRNEIL